MNTDGGIIATPLRGLSFKGNRTYLRGTDIMRAVMAYLADKYPSVAPRDLDIAFHGLASTGLTLLDPAPPDVAANVVFACAIAETAKRLALVEDGRPIDERVDFAEDGIVAATRIHVATATATSAGPFPCASIERWVTMVKSLHHAVYPGLQGRWLFVRGKFARYQDEYGPAARHQVAIEANLGNRMTRSSLTVDGQKLGDIYFALD